MIQTTEKIEDIELTVMIDDDGTKYYSIQQIYKRFYNRDINITQLKEPIKRNIKRINIEYVNEYANGSISSVINETACLPECVIPELLISFRRKSATQQQIINHNKLRRKFGMDEIIEDMTVILKSEFNKSQLELYREYELKSHDMIINDFTHYASCNVCGVYYPIHQLFYPKDKKTKYGYEISRCTKCRSKHGKIKGENKFFKNKRIDELFEIYEAIENDDERIKFSEKVKEEEGLIVESLEDILNYHFKDVKMCNFTQELFFEIREKYNIDASYVKAIDILYGLDFYMRPYEVDIARIPTKDVNFEHIKIIFNNFLNDKGIIIDEPLDFNYGDILTKSKGCVYVSRIGNIMDFVLMYNDYKYDAYKFTNVVSSNYWGKEENVLENLKSLILNELPIDNNIDKIPIYLTKSTLKRISPSLYRILLNKYGGSIFSLVNKIYPDRFTEKDFNILHKRDVFDSLEEEEVHNILLKKFGKALIYNSGDCNGRIPIIGGYQPDWFVLRENKKPLIVEYFGMYVNNPSNKRTLDYKEKTEYKISIYNTLEWYDKLYIFQSDLKYRYKGLLSKISDL